MAHGFDYFNFTWNTPFICFKKDKRKHAAVQFTEPINFTPGTQPENVLNKPKDWENPSLAYFSFFKLTVAVAATK